MNLQDLNTQQLKAVQKEFDEFKSNNKPDYLFII